MTGINASPIEIGFNNNNDAGILGCETANDSPPDCPAADQDAAKAVETGLELSIDLADNGNPDGKVRVMLLQNNSGHDFLSNQSLGGMPAGTGNLGSGFYNIPVNEVDFSDDMILGGDQFFTVPEPASLALVFLSMIGLLALRCR